MNKVQTFLTGLLAFLLALPAWGQSSIQYNEDDVAKSGDQGTMCLAVERDTAASSAGASGDYATLNVDRLGKLWVNAGGSGTDSIGKAEDYASADADVGVPALTLRADTPAAGSGGTDGDYQWIQTDALGYLWVTGTQKEDNAHSSTDKGHAVWGVRDDALASGGGADTDGDYTAIRSDSYGALWTHPLTTTNVLTDTAVVETNAYASGDCLDAAAESLTGTAATAPFLSGRITDVVITDLQAQNANMDVIFFNADPGNICAAINGAADIDDDDLSKVVGAVHITDWVTLNDNGIGQALNQNIKYSLASGTTLYYGLITRGTPTYGSASDLVIKVKVELD